MLLYNNLTRVLVVVYNYKNGAELFPLHFKSLIKIKMKKILVLICFFGFLNSFAQTTEENNYSSEVFESEQEGLNLLSNYNLTPVNPESQATYNIDNSILIEQVGYNNNIYSKTQSQSSDITLIQNGNYNDINLNVNAPRIDTAIFQNGDNNKAVDNIYYYNSDVSLNLIQNGDNLTFNRIGVNSLTSKIQFVQEGSFKTITVISN